jgi:hypothetical protein
VANAVVGIDPMNNQVCTPIVTPVVVVASHEELVRSARDLWAVAVSLLTELTPDKFTTAPWAAGLFTVELPFILAKLWHLQQGIISSAHSYMQTETMLQTVIETIDVPKLLQEFSSWAVELAPLKDLPFGFSQHVPPVSIMPPTSVDIIQQRFQETTWSNQSLIRHESYQLANGDASHWFYLPKDQDWAVINSYTFPNPIDEKLEGFVKNRVFDSEHVFYVGQRDGDLVIPSPKVMQEHSTAISGEVNVYRMV